MSSKRSIPRQAQAGQGNPLQSVGWLPRNAAGITHDLPSVHSQVLAAAQNPIHASAFDDKIVDVAWGYKPNWYLRAENDRMIDPALQHAMAAHIQAFTRSVVASHVPFMSRPKETTAFIVEAVNNVLTLRSRNGRAA